MWIDFVIAGLLITAVTFLIVRSARRRKAGCGGCVCSGSCGACTGCVSSVSDSGEK